MFTLCLLTRIMVCFCFICNSPENPLLKYIFQDGSVEIPELVVHMKNSIKDARKRESIEATLPLIFDAIDTNNDGRLTYEEFSAYYSSLGINDTKIAKEVFTEMDTNGDCEISRQGKWLLLSSLRYYLLSYLNIEFLEFGIEFFFGTDPNNPVKRRPNFFIFHFSN